MKNPLRYQLSEYDCGPTSMLNALAFLFEREDIPPEAVRNIMLYCLDCYGSDGVSGKSGTSCAAMMFLSNWLNGFGKIGRLHISTQYLSGPAVILGRTAVCAMHSAAAALRGAPALRRRTLCDTHRH